jgi:hypothetical protein
VKFFYLFYGMATRGSYKYNRSRFSIRPFPSVIDPWQVGIQRTAVVALKLNLSEHAVWNYLLRIFDKFGISRRAELVHYAFSGVEGSAASVG